MGDFLVCESAYRDARQAADCFESYKYAEELWSICETIAASPSPSTGLARICDGIGWAEGDGVHLWRPSGASLLLAMDGVASFCRAGGAGVAAATPGGDVRVSTGADERGVVAGAVPPGATVVAATATGDRILVAHGDDPSLHVLADGALAGVSGGRRGGRVLSAAATTSGGFAALVDDGG